MTIEITNEQAGAVVALIRKWRDSLPSQPFSERMGFDTRKGVKYDLTQVEGLIIQAAKGFITP